MGRISTSSRYVIEIAGTDPISLEDFRGAEISSASGRIATLKTLVLRLILGSDFVARTT